MWVHSAGTITALLQIYLPARCIGTRVHKCATLRGSILVGASCMDQATHGRRPTTAGFCCSARKREAQIDTCSRHTRTEPCWHLMGSCKLHRGEREIVCVRVCVCFPLLCALSCSVWASVTCALARINLLANWYYITAPVASRYSCAYNVFDECLSLLHNRYFTLSNPGRQRP